MQEPRESGDDKQEPDRTSPNPHRDHNGRVVDHPGSKQHGVLTPEDDRLHPVGDSQEPNEKLDHRHLLHANEQPIRPVGETLQYDGSTAAPDPAN